MTIRRLLELEKANMSRFCRMSWNAHVVMELQSYKSTKQHIIDKVGDMFSSTEFLSATCQSKHADRARARRMGVANFYNTCSDWSTTTLKDVGLQFSDSARFIRRFFCVGDKCQQAVTSSFVVNGGQSIHVCVCVCVCVCKCYRYPFAAVVHSMRTGEQHCAYH